MSQSINNRTIVNNVSFGPLSLSSGEILEEVTLQYERVGPPDAPVILVCHALTGNHHTVGDTENPGWWSGLVGDKKYIDTEKYQVITFNILGGCNGSTGPAAIIPNTNRCYQATFPAITIRDMVHAQYKALKEMGITELRAIIGGSLGGMQVMEWGLLYPEMIESLIMLAATPVFSSYGIAFNHIAASSIRQDPNWKNGYYNQKDLPIKGLEVARMVGMVTYRSPHLFRERFENDKTDRRLEVMSYLNYQGKKLSNRFDPNSYLCLLEAMNTHDIGAGRGGWENATKAFSCPILTISFENDLIYEDQLIQSFAKTAPETRYHHIHTQYGHDGFLTEFEKWGNLITDFI